MNSCTKYASAVATNLTTRPINTTTIPPIDIGPIGGNTSPDSHVGAARRVSQRNDYSNTTPSPSSLFVNDPDNGRLPITTEQRSGLRPSIVRVTTVSSYLAPSARNRHHGRTISMSPVLIQGSIPVANAPDPQPALPSIPVPIVSDTTANQLTTVPEEQCAMHEDTLTPPKGGRCYPSVPPASSSTIRRERLVLGLGLVEALCFMVFFRPDMQTPAELVSPMSSCLAIGASSTSNNAPVGTSGGLALYGATIERDQTENEGPPLRISTRLLTATSQPQLLPEPQQRLDWASSDSPSTRLPDTVATTTNSTSSGTLATADASLSSAEANGSYSLTSNGSDQQRARDSQPQPLEETTAEDETQLAERAPEIVMVSLERGPMTGGVRVCIVGTGFPSTRLYVGFGDAFTPAVCIQYAASGEGLTSVGFRVEVVKPFCNAHSLPPPARERSL